MKPASFRQAASPVPMGHRVPVQFRPVQRHPMLSQTVNVNPEINAPINIGLGSLPVTLGSFAAAGTLALIGAKNPGIRTYTTIGSILLTGFGILNIFSGREAQAAEAVPGGGELPGAVSHSGGGDADASVPIAPTSEDAFRTLEARVISPSEWQTVPLSPFSSEVPIRIRISNPSSQPVTFDLVFTADEIPAPFGDEQVNTTSTRISLGAGEMRDIDIPLALVTWGWSADTVDVYLTVEKRRTTGGPTALLDRRAFQID